MAGRGVCVAGVGFLLVRKAATFAQPAAWGVRSSDGSTGGNEVPQAARGSEGPRSEG